jgi:hypothetical protein
VSRRSYLHGVCIDTRQSATISGGRTHKGTKQPGLLLNPATAVCRRRARITQLTHAKMISSAIMLAYNHIVELMCVMLKAAQCDMMKLNT